MNWHEEVAKALLEIEDNYLEDSQRAVEGFKKCRERIAKALGIVPPTRDHDWVLRTDGYEEQCGPAICRKCGRYGCWCDAKYSEMTANQKRAFKKRGIPGNDHEIEKRIKAEETKHGTEHKHSS